MFCLTRRVGASTLGVAAVVFALFASPVLGHGSGASIQLGAERIQPGGTTTVRGTGMSPDEQVVFEIGDPTRALPIGSATAAGDGELDAVLVIPVTTPVGEWEVYARGSDGGSATTHLTVAGPPVEAGEACDPLEPGEICPTLPPATSPAPASTAAPAPTTAAALPGPTFQARTLAPQSPEAPAVGPATTRTSAPDGGLGWLIAAGGGLAIVVLVVVAIRLRKPRPN